MLNNLPNEIIYSICKNLDINSINNLKYVNSNLYHTINNLSSLIVKYELKKINNKLNFKNMCSFLNNFIKIILYKHLYNNEIEDYKLYKNIKYDFKNTAVICSTNFLEKEKFYNSHSFIISYNKNVNTLFIHVLNHYIFNGNIDKYDKINLLFLYNFIQIEQFNISEINYYIQFIEELTFNKYNRHFDDIITNYYTFLIKNLNYEDSFTYVQELNHKKYIEFLQLEQLYKMSKWITTPHIIKKLLSYKPLNLDSTEFLACCKFCYRSPIDEIVKMKFNMRDNDLIGYNYSCFKNLLLKNNNNNNNIVVNIYNEVEILEKRLVNRYIFTINPVTNKKERLIFNRYNNNSFMHMIKNKQRFLINKIFN